MPKINRHNLMDLSFNIQCSSFAGEGTSPGIFFSRMFKKQAVDFGNWDSSKNEKEILFT
jgi:hypothetical protein